MKRLKLNYLFIGIVTLLLALALWPNVSWRGDRGDLIEEIKSRGELRIGTLVSPISYYSTNEGPAGLDYELSKLFAEYLGVKLKVVTYRNISELFPALEDDKVDMIASSLIYNRDRQAQFRVGPAYYSVSQQLVYRQGTAKPKTLTDLKEPLMVVSGSAHASTLNELKKKKYPDLSWTISSDLSSQDLLLQIANGKLKYTIADSVTVAILQRIYPQLAVAFDITDEEPVMWYINKAGGDNLYAAILDFFNQSVEDGTIARLEEKYLGHVGSFDYVDTKTFLRAIDQVLPDLKPLFEKYADRIHWKMLAAIAYQESHWNPQATSPTGVRGLMMLTRATADGVGVTDRINPEQSIRGGAKYLQQLMDKIPSTVPEDERIWFALAAYNMGFGHMLDVRALTKKQGGNPDSWVEVKQRLPMLSQKRYYTQTNYGYARGHEAYKYVENIRRYMVSLTGYLQEKEKQAALKAEQEKIMKESYPTVKSSDVD